MAGGHLLFFPNSKAEFLLPTTTLVAFGIARAENRNVLGARLHFADGSYSKPGDTRVRQTGRKWYLVFRNVNQNAVGLELTWVKNVDGRGKTERFTKEVKIDVKQARTLSVNVIYPPGSPSPFEISVENFAAWGTCNDDDANIVDMPSFSSDSYSKSFEDGTWVIEYGTINANPGDELELVITADNGTTSSTPVSRLLKVEGGGGEPINEA